MSMIILANGEYPRHSHLLELLRQTDCLIACDGAAESLLADGLEPDWIVGDLDSLPESLQTRFAERMIHESEQETNDLSKAFRFALTLLSPEEELIILGATGKREDHTLGNISLLADFSRLHRKIRLLTDTGEFAAVYSGEPIPCRPGQAISIFNPTTEKIAATSEGLKYPLNGLELNIWWRATLNTAHEDHFTLTFNSSAPLLVFLAF